MTAVNYHAALFALLDETPHMPPQAVAEVDTWEAKHRQKLPAAVREWFRLDGPALWRKYRPHDFVPALAENPPLQWLEVKELDRSGQCSFPIVLSERSSETSETVEPIHPGRFIVLSTETDCGISTIVRIDDADDPTLGLYGESHGPHTKIEGTFSTWVFDAFLDEESAVIDASHQRLFPIIVTATDNLPSEDDLDRLRAAFCSGPVGMGGILGWNYRFYNDGNFVLIGKSPCYDEPDRRTWEIRSRSAADLCNTLGVLWPLGNLRRTLVLERGDENLHSIMQSARHLEGSREEVATQWLQMAAIFSKRM